MELGIHFLPGRASTQFHCEPAQHVGKGIIKRLINITKIVGEGVAAFDLGQHQVECAGHIPGGFSVPGDDALRIPETWHGGSSSGRVVDRLDHFLAAFLEIDPVSTNRQEPAAKPGFILRGKVMQPFE